MKVLVINNDGGGFADYVDVPEGSSCPISARGGAV